MRKFLGLVAIAAAPLFVPSTAAAQTAPGVQGGPNITVEGSRIICRREVRTATRMRTGRVCRTQAEWRGSGAAMATSHDDIEDAANQLEMDGEKVSTNCIGAELTRDNGRTPLGPR